MTNATKGALLGALNTVLALLDLFGVHSTTKTNGIVLLIANAILGLVIFATRKLSPKWQAEVNTVATDVVKAVDAAAPAVKAVAEKKTAKTTKTTAKKTAEKK